MGDLITLQQGYRRLTITALAACRVLCPLHRFDSTAPTAPAADPDPAGGAEGSYVSLVAGSVYQTPWVDGGALYRYVQVWELAAGDLVISGDPA